MQATGKAVSGQPLAGCAAVSAAAAWLANERVGWIDCRSCGQARARLL